MIGKKNSKKKIRSDIFEKSGINFKKFQVQEHTADHPLLVYRQRGDTSGGSLRPSEPALARSLLPAVLSEVSILATSHRSLLLPDHAADRLLLSHQPLLPLLLLESLGNK